MCEKYVDLTIGKVYSFLASCNYVDFFVGICILSDPLSKLLEVLLMTISIFPTFFSIQTVEKRGHHLELHQLCLQPKQSPFSCYK